MNVRVSETGGGETPAAVTRLMYLAISCSSSRISTGRLNTKLYRLNRRDQPGLVTCPNLCGARLAAIKSASGQEWLWNSLIVKSYRVSAISFARVSHARSPAEKGRL